MNIVCHRGIFSTTSFPLENTVNAFEMAWGTLGYTYCECDVVLTKDRVLLLQHDTTFTRLLHASLNTHPFAHTPISQLTLSDIQTHIRLRHGLPPDTLLDLVACAHRLSLQHPHLPRKQIVLELKCTETEEYSVYAQTLLRVLTPHTLPYIAVMMSFDLNILSLLSSISPFPRTVPLLYLTDVFDLTEENVTALLTQIERLDGVYLQYQPEWHTTETGQTQLDRIVKQGWMVGIWNDSKQPDGKDIRFLLPSTIDFINTDIHLEEMDSTLNHHE